MIYEFEKNDKAIIVKITAKRATIEFSGSFKDALLKKIDMGEINFVVDLSKVGFVDSSFLGTLVIGLKKTKIKNGALKICELQPPVRAMFELARLYRIFDIYDTLEEAVSSY